MATSPKTHTGSNDPTPASDRRRAWPVRVWRFYVDGFKSMTVGKSLWALILIKLAFIFLVLKIFFFPDILARDYDTDEERAAAVRHSMLQQP